MTVTADCSDCGSIHVLDKRIVVDGTTKCPECGSKRYSTSCTTDSLSEDEIRATLRSVDGVGDGIIDNLEASLGSLTLVSSRTVEQLSSVEGVGPTTADRILNAV